ncbi:MAG TPA: cystathionine beta-lyase [Stellaceae bacterium]|nr:cystathionine beta-lyase [Stellaceae bacterium]
MPPKPATRLVHAGRRPAEHHGAVNPAIYRASTILKPDLETWREAVKPGSTEYRYGLLATPTSRAFEEAMAELYGVETCVAVSSGLAMVTIALLALTRGGDHILVTDSAYEPTRRFCDGMLARFGVETTYYDPTIGAGIAGLMRPNTRIVFTESPGSLTFEVQDIPAIVEAAHRHGAKVIIDNAWATALRFNPFRHGVDVVLEATSKYVGGHSDVILGVMLANGETARRLHWTAKTLGVCCGPDDLYLAQRGLRTLGVRLDRSEATGLELARWLQKRREVARILYPALPGDPGHALWQRDFSGAAGLFSIVLHPVPPAALDAFFADFKLFGIGVSWGGYESLVITQDLAETRSAVPWTDPGPLIRFYAGLEDPQDLIEDVDAAFRRLTAAC